MDPSILAKVHSGIALLVIVLYIVRGGLMLASSSILRSVILTAVTHTTVLILILMGLYTAYSKGIPFTNSFVITKIICITLFILLGGVALKQGLPKLIAIILWILGLIALIYALSLGYKLAPVFF